MRNSAMIPVNATDAAARCLLRRRGMKAQMGLLWRFRRMVGFGRASPSLRGK